MKNHLAIAGLVLFLSTGTVFAQTASGKPKDAYKHLATARTFAVGYIGRGGVISSTEKDLWELLKAKDEKSLLALTKEKNTVAQLYGLLGLRYLGSAQQKNIASSLAKSSGEVQTISGCLVYDKNVATVATQIAQGTYDSTLKQDLEHPR